MIYKQVDVKEAEKNLRDRLISELESGKNVLWLVSGGSNIEVTVQIMNIIPAKNTEHLSIMLIDERFGKPGHEDSNWQQLMQAGLSPKNAHLMPVLLSHSALEQTAMHYNNMAAQAFAENDVCIAQVGMGKDGHIAGILPHTVTSVDNQQLAVGYKSEPFDRLTLTFSALEMMDVIYVFAYGKSKQEAITTLQNEGLSPDDQPAQFLKQLPEVYLYSDQVADE